MVNELEKGFFQPPVFKDEESSRLAKMLFYILWAIILVVGCILIAWLIRGNLRELGPYAFIANLLVIGISLGLLIVVRKGFIKISSFILVSFLWANFAFQVFTSDGLRGSSTLIFIAIIVLASLLLGWRISIGFTALSIIYCWILAWVEKSGFSTFQIDEPYGLAIEVTALFILTSVFLTLTTSGLSTALERARNREKELQDSEKRFRNLFESVSDFLYFHNLDGKFIKTNFSLKKEYGIDWNISDYPNLRDIVPKRYGQQVDDYFNRIKENGKDKGILNVRIKDHDLIIAYNNSLVYDSNGMPTGVQGSGRDITEQVKAKNEKKKVEQQLLHAQKMQSIGTLAGGIAHDFNNILSAVIGYTELLQMSLKKNSTESEYANQIQQAGNRAKDLVQQILTFSRQSKQELKPVEVRIIVKEVTQLLRSILPANIEIRQNIQSHSTVMGDPTQLHQILMNLCTNAGHAMKEKGGSLTIELDNIELKNDILDHRANLTPGIYLHMNVSDTGQGMPSEILDRVFDPFFTTKKQGEGTGMGLSVVHGIVQSFGGTIFAQSEDGKGSTFTVILPVIEGSAKPDKHELEDIPRGTENILLIDDEPALVEMGKTQLESLGYKVSSRSSSLEGLEFFKNKPNNFDLVITDLTMPQMSGDELIKAIKRIRPDIPVILCTGFSTKVTPESAHLFDIDALLMKPIIFRKMAKVVRNVLDEL